MKDDINQEVQSVLEKESEGVRLEDVPNEQSSPLNQGVKEKDIAGATDPSEDVESDPIFNTRESQEPLDAPEQEIGEERAHFQESESEDFDMPKSAAAMAADALLGSVNNYVGVGAGFFIRIRKHKDFYEFEEIIRIVDDQNEKNIQRIQFDEEDMALLRPILIVVIQKRAKQLTPEQQLLSVLLSIMVKKVQVVMQIRVENDLLTERILDIIREEKGVPNEPPEAENPLDHQKEELTEEEEYETIETLTEEYSPQATLESQILDVSPSNEPDHSPTDG